MPNGVETLPKISIAVVGRTNITDRRDPTRSVDSFRRDRKSSFLVLLAYTAH